MFRGLRRDTRLNPHNLAQIVSPHRYDHKDVYPRRLLIPKSLQPSSELELESICYSIQQKGGSRFSLYSLRRNVFN
jgi:hypothetical protein